MSTANNLPRSNDGAERITLRPMLPADFEACLHLSATAGWNQLVEDWRLLQGLNPEGCFVACQKNQVVGSVATTNYGGRVGWISMVLVDPGFRGQGIATRLLESALKALSHLETILLDATPDGRRVYKRIGFEDGFGLTRMVSTGISGRLAGTGADGLRSMQLDDLAAVAKWDARILGGSREKVLQGLLETAPEYAWIIQRGKAIDGFAMGRHGAKFEQIGPLVAADIDGAKTLCNTLLGKMEGRAVTMDTPDSATAWRAYIDSLGMMPERPFTRMFLGPPPTTSSRADLFAVAGPELG